MRRLFVDSFYYLALLNPRDAHRAQALQVNLTIEDHFWTTDLVLIEVANALSAPQLRHHAATYLHKLEQSPDTTIIRLTPDFFSRSLELYEQRTDKAWSLTDCFSFVVMQDYDIHEALTGDHHFVQAGFLPLLREGQRQ